MERVATPITNTITDNGPVPAVSAQDATSKGSWSDKVSGKQTFQHEDNKEENEMENWEDWVSEDEMMEAFQALRWHQPEKKGLNPLRMPLDLVIAKRTFGLLSKAGILVFAAEEAPSRDKIIRNEKRWVRRGEVNTIIKDPDQSSNPYNILRTEQMEDLVFSQDDCVEVNQPTAAENDDCVEIPRSAAVETDVSRAAETDAVETDASRTTTTDSNRDVEDDTQDGDAIRQEAEEKEKSNQVHDGSNKHLASSLVVQRSEECIGTGTPLALLQMAEQSVQISQATEGTNTMSNEEVIQRFNQWKVTL
ncbi:hypothetical protein R1sor_011097 [Riccia sorocarpa]|uniref:Uncharacterized protein n=1 Tax=Riccia sorocarpa TaxID=122646 RepID=A0ABD3I1B1_9MARC